MGRLRNLALTAMTLIAGYAVAAETDFPTFAVGGVTVSLLSEGDRQGSAGILLNASDSDKNRYLTNDGFANAINAFLVRADGKNILIDAAFGQKLFDQLAALNIAPEQIHAVLLTHLHGDHIGGLLRNGKIAFPNAAIFVAEKELAYWQNQPAAATLARYGKQVKSFSPDEIATIKNSLPGMDKIYPVAAYGHTPGHTMYLIQDNADRLLVWGDLTHAMAIQIPVPTVAVSYDVDPVQAVKTREKIFAWVTAEKIPIAGMHIASPAMGKLQPGDHSGSYLFKPLP